MLGYTQTWEVCFVFFPTHVLFLALFLFVNEAWMSKLNHANIIHTHDSYNYRSLYVLFFGRCYHAAHPIVFFIIFRTSFELENVSIYGCQGVIEVSTWGQMKFICICIRILKGSCWGLERVVEKYLENLRFTYSCRHFANKFTNNNNISYYETGAHYLNSIFRYSQRCSPQLKTLWQPWVPENIPILWTSG